MTTLRTVIEPIVVLDGLAKAGNHDGGALAFGPDGMLYAGVGDAGVPDRAQDPDSLNGKILRMTPDGDVPDDNPTPASLVWTMGHRNVQGLTWDEGGRMYASEFGQDTFDEVNLIEPGNNYGWPVVEGEGDDPTYTNPLVTWSTDEASPSGIAAIGDGVYVGALRGQRLWRVPLDGGDPEALLDQQYGRLRNVQRAPDGSLWITTSNRDGRGIPTTGTTGSCGCQTPTARRSAARPSYAGRGVSTPARWRSPGSTSDRPSAQHQHQVAAVDGLGAGEREPLDGAGAGRGDRGLHLHRLDGGDGLAGLDLLALLHDDGDRALERRGDVARVARRRPSRRRPPPRRRCGRGR